MLLRRHASNASWNWSNSLITFELSISDRSGRKESLWISDIGISQSNLPNPRLCIFLWDSEGISDADWAWGIFWDAEAISLCMGDWSELTHDFAFWVSFLISGFVCGSRNVTESFKTSITSKISMPAKGTGRSESWTICLLWGERLSKFQNASVRKLYSVRFAVGWNGVTVRDDSRTQFGHFPIA
jgi:hypothetical protein